MTYRQLDQESILRTLEKLQLRVAEKFPLSGLSKVAAELLVVGREVCDTVGYLRRPNLAIRVPAGISIGIMIGVVVLVLASAISGSTTSDAVDIPRNMGELAPWVQVLDATLNNIIFVGAATFFLLTVENRLKRRRALEVLHELRSLAHVVDMHQLAKDPEVMASGVIDETAPPEPVKSLDELGRYLDYCTDLLSLNAKLAALLVQDFNDEVVLAGVNEIEALTTGLSTKIGQKIRLTERLRAV